MTPKHTADTLRAYLQAQDADIDHLYNELQRRQADMNAAAQQYVAEHYGINTRDLYRYTKRLTHGGEVSMIVRITIAAMSSGRVYIAAHEYTAEGDPGKLTLRLTVDDLPHLTPAGITRSDLPGLPE